MSTYDTASYQQIVNEKIERKKHRRLFRLILPAFPPFNIYSRIAKHSTIDPQTRC